MTQFCHTKLNSSFNLHHSTQEGELSPLSLGYRGAAIFFFRKCWQNLNASNQIQRLKTSAKFHKDSIFWKQHQWKSNASGEICSGSLSSELLQRALQRSAIRSSTEHAFCPPDDASYSSVFRFHFEKITEYLCATFEVTEMIEVFSKCISTRRFNTAFLRTYRFKKIPIHIRILIQEVLVISNKIMHAGRYYLWRTQHIR